MNFTTTEILYALFLLTGAYAQVVLGRASLKKSFSSSISLARFASTISFFAGNYLIKQAFGPFNGYVYTAIAAGIILAVIQSFILNDK